jgi:hypothetical protein
MPSFLALDAVDGAIGCFLVGLPVQCHFDREPAPSVVSNDLDAANGFAPGPLSDLLEALFSESPVAHSNCFHRLRHGSALYNPGWPLKARFQKQPTQQDRIRDSPAAFLESRGEAIRRTIHRRRDLGRQLVNRGII